MKTNGIPSQLKQGWEQANVTFGKAQAVRAAIDNGGVANGVCEGIKQFCGDKPNIIAQGLVKIKDSKIGKFLIKNMFKIHFNGDGDTLLKSESCNLAKETGQEGQLGGYLLQLVDQNKWLTNLTCNICNKTSKFISGNLEKLINKIPNDGIKQGIKDILGQVDSSNSKARERKANKEAQKEEYNKIKQNIEKNNITLEELNDIIEDSEVSLSDSLKDKIYMVWAQNHTDCGEGDKQDILDALSNKGKRNLGINDNLTKKQKIEAETKAINNLFTKGSSVITKLIDT